MATKMKSPVQTQMAVELLKSPFVGEFHEPKKMGVNIPVGQGRVFIQTETGCVLGLELDRRDNAHTVKRTWQVTLNFPTQDSSLTFGDDLTALRNESHLHKSSSNPCLSPLGVDVEQRDHISPIEILSHSDRFSVVDQMVKDTIKAIKIGIDPITANGGLGGAYYFRNVKGENVAIVKPIDEEPFAPNNPKGFVGKALGQPGLRRSVRVGETGYREVAAYLLDKDHFANVPPTALVKITHSIFNVNDDSNGNKSKIASFQQFVPHDFDASDYGTSSFPVSAVHRIGILDIRIFNTDRHAGNLLVKKLDGDGRFCQVELIPIDHGLCLPETLDDPYFEWIHWPQASIPFSEDELEYIANLDPFEDCKMLRTELPMVREACLRILILCTIFLKEAAVFGLCLAEMGEMMSREFRPVEEKPSELEVICLEAIRLIGEKEVMSPKSDINGDAEFQFDLDCEGSILDSPIVQDSPLLPPVGAQAMSQSQLPRGNPCLPLLKLEETINEEEEEDEEDNNGYNEECLTRPDGYERIPSSSKLSPIVLDSPLLSPVGAQAMSQSQFPRGTPCLPLLKLEETINEEEEEEDENEERLIPADGYERIPSISKLSPIVQDSPLLSPVRAQAMSQSQFPRGNPCLPLLKLQETINEEEEEEDNKGYNEERLTRADGYERIPSISKLSPIVQDSPLLSPLGAQAMSQFPRGNPCLPLLKLQETINEEEEDNERYNEERLIRPDGYERIPSSSKLSISLTKYTKYVGANEQSSNHRSANEQFPTNSSFVKLSDMNKEEWNMFLEKFQEVLHLAFAKRKWFKKGQTQRQRLGTSCQF